MTPSQAKERGIKVRALEFDSKGTYASVEVGTGFTAYYSIEPLEFDLEEVRFGVHCHEFGDNVIWRGPVLQGQAAANNHNEARILAALE